jgi:FkbM family methyltransferase
MKLFALLVLAKISQILSKIVSIQVFKRICTVFPQGIRKHLLFESNYRTIHEVKILDKTFFFEVYSRDEFFFEFQNSTFQEWEKSSLEWWVNNCSSQTGPGRVLDLGAYSGIYSIAAAAAGKSVVAFEPNSETFKLLERNVKLNNFMEKIEVRNFALGAEPGILDLAVETFRNYSSGSRVVSKQSSVDESVWRILQSTEVKRLDDVIGSHQVDLMKIDVEGFELDVLNGALNTLTNNRIQVLIEVLSPETFERVKTLMQSLGYLLDSSFCDSHGGRNYVFSNLY